MLISLQTTLTHLSKRLRKGDLHRTVGRFKFARQTYSFYQNKRQQLNADFYRSRLAPRSESFLTGISPTVCVKKLREKGVSLGLQLPASDVEEVYQFACASLCHEPGFEEEFCADEVEVGRLGERHVFRGLVENPRNCPAVEQVAEDPSLLQIARDYLRYWPSQVVPHLTWSFVSGLPADQQRGFYPPLNYHYDVAGYNFMTAYFYITDVDALSGAHVMIERSHNKKPPHTLFSPFSGIHSAQRVLDYYGKESELLIEGKAGFGFVQDPSCFHKLLSPLKSRRLLPQIRYA